MATNYCNVRIRGSETADEGFFYVDCITDAGKLRGTLALQRVRLASREPAMGVSSIEVKVGSRRRGIGTALYEAAAEHACKVYGLPLASGRSRSNSADKFWRKQERKGRAKCTADSGGKLRACVEYVLTCPAPATLAGARKRKRSITVIR